MTSPIGMMVTKNSRPSTSGFMTLYSSRPNFIQSRLSGARGAESVGHDQKRDGERQGPVPGRACPPQRDGGQDGEEAGEDQAETAIGAALDVLLARKIS